MEVPFLEALREEVAILQAKHPILADVLSRANALLVEGRLWVEDDGQHAMVQSSDGTTWYHVNSTCVCPASQYRDAPCKHRLALRLYPRVSARLLETEERWAPTDLAPLDTAAPAQIDSKHIVRIQDKPYVRYVGLLALAHARGLQELRADWTYNDAALSLAHAVAVFPFGQFEESGDATPENCTKKVAIHFRRVALTRAKARVLRDALGVDLVAVEELAEEGA